MVLYTLWMAASHGYTIAPSDDYDDVRTKSADSETIHDVVPFKYHARLEALHVYYLDQLCTQGAFRPWQFLTPERFTPKPRWYRELQEEVPHLPTVLRPLPTRPTTFSTEWTPLPLASAATFRDVAVRMDASCFPLNVASVCTSAYPTIQTRAVRYAHTRVSYIRRFPPPHRG